jgi:hypothetical protein
MQRVRCPTCGVEHDLGAIEPYFDRPDAFFDLPADQRASRSWNAEDLCVVWESDNGPRRHFIRAILPIPIRGEQQDYGWGVWVEVSETDFTFTHDHGSDPSQAVARTFSGALANALPDMPSTRGLAGSVRLTGPDTLPFFLLRPGEDHPLAHEQREGVFPERIVEWAVRAAHGSHRDPAT